MKIQAAMIDPNKRIIDLTLGELFEELNNTFVLRQEPVSQHVYESRQVYGINGIAQLLGCSTSTVNRLKKSGVFANAIKQYGRIIIADADKLLQIYNETI